jgi:hypothetical protein
MAKFFQKQGLSFWLLSWSNIYDGDRSIDSTTVFAGLYGNTNIKNLCLRVDKWGGILPLTVWMKTGSGKI